MLLKRAEPNIENAVLENNQKNMKDLQFEDNFKVYLMLRRDGTHIFNSNGQVALKVFTDNELIKILTSGQIFEIPDEC